nr:non-ribosomal peptide synthase [Catenulispora sp.]
MTIGARGRAIRKAVSPSDLWWLAHPPAISPVIQVVVEGDGDVDPRALAAALAAVAAVCPDTAPARRGRRWLAGGPPPRVRVVEAPAGRQVADLPALHEPLPGSDGAFCEVLWCPGTPSALVFRASHAVMDWPGMSLWITETFRALRGEPLVGAASTVTETDVFDKFATSDAAPAGKPKVDCVSPLGEPESPGAHRTLWRRRTVDGYHPALVAKVAAALTGAYGLDAARYAIAFDLRRHVPQERTTGSLSQVELFEVEAGEPWEALHERLLTAMAEAQEVTGRVEVGLLKMPLPLVRTMIKTLEKVPAAKRKYASRSVLAHLGRVDAADLCGPEFEARTLYLLPMLTAMSPPDVNLVECGGRTEVTLTWRDGPGIGERAEAVLDQVVRALSPDAPRPGEAGQPAVPPMSATTVVDRFRVQAEQNPDGLALSWPDGTMTFAELDHRSEVAAAVLLEAGVRRGSVVGLLADRTPAAVVGIWGALKAGAAYLPLDPRHPDRRLAGILADAGATVCMTQDSYSSRPVRPEDGRTVVLEELPFDREQKPVGTDPGPEDLAYVIYTSGSTGKPKGVQIEHRAIACYAEAAVRSFGLDAETRFALITPLSFDLSNTALFAPTTVGGAVVLEPGEPDHLTLRRVLEQSGADTLSLTPTHLDLVNRLGLKPAGFRSVVVVGEQLRRSVAVRAQEVFGPECVIHNMYGPTEATVGLTAHRFDAGTDGAAAVPIGGPMDGSRIHLLDAQRRFVPAGEVGEMYLGGLQVARGYLGRRDLTRERFVLMADGTRAYRSGDLARTLPGGGLEFVGRADDQVKVLGHRIEPAEIAQCLEEHPAVRAAVVVARTRPGGDDKRLYGYVVLAPDADQAGAGADDFARHLGERLPPYMIPSATTVVEEIPYDANGKVDVKALPDPLAGAGAAAPPSGEAGTATGTATGSDTATATAAELDDVERAVAGIWAATLGVDGARIDGRTDFLLLGGNSVQMLSMLADVCRDVVGPEREQAFMACLGQIIREPTVERVSELARKAGSESVYTDARS